MITPEDRQRIDTAWERRSVDGIDVIGEAVDKVIALLDAGRIRIAEPVDGNWQVNEWAKKAILLYFRLHPMSLIEGTAGGSWWDKIPSKFAGWTAESFTQAGFRAVPGSVVRRGAYVAANAVLMPCFVNIGAYIGTGTMIDTWAAVGSGAQIGSNVHISGGAGIGGVLEPVQASPVIIEDNCFIGARSEVAEGVIVERNAVLSMGVYIGRSTKIVDRQTGAIHYGRVPAGSVVVPGSLPAASADKPSLYCAVIIKRVDERTRAKTAINVLLREEDPV